MLIIIFLIIGLSVFLYFKKFKQKISVTNYIIYTLGIIVLAIFIKGMYFDKPVTNVYYESNKPNASTSEKSWYEGGTLHKATIDEWKIASEENKLATCADFIASFNKSISMPELKIKAASLVVCIDEAAKGISFKNRETVPSVASLCIQTMKQ